MEIKLISEQYRKFVSSIKDVLTVLRLGVSKVTTIDGKITACDTDNVTVVASAIPTGAATAANQVTEVARLTGIEGYAATIAGDTTSLDGKVTACNTGAVVVSSSALPAGAATSAIQTDGTQKAQRVDGAGNVAPAGHNVANPVQVRIGDGATRNLSIKQDGDGSGNGVEINAYYEVDPAAAVTTKTYKPRLSRYKFILGANVNDHYRQEGRGFGGLTPTVGLAVAAGAAVDLVLIASAAASRTVIIDELIVSIQGDDCIVEVSTVPTVKANGTALNLYNYADFSATAATCSAFYSPTITAQGNRLWGEIVRNNHNVKFAGALDYNTNRILVRATNLVAMGAGSTAWVSLKLYEVA